MNFEIYSHEPEPIEPDDFFGEAHFDPCSVVDAWDGLVHTLGNPKIYSNGYGNYVEVSTDIFSNPNGLNTNGNTVESLDNGRSRIYEPKHYNEYKDECDNHPGGGSAAILTSQVPIEGVVINSNGVSAISVEGQDAFMPTGFESTPDHGIDFGTYVPIGLGILGLGTALAFAWSKRQSGGTLATG